MDKPKIGGVVKDTLAEDTKSIEETLLDAMSRKQGVKTSDTHSSHSIYVKKELMEKVDILAAAQPRGFKTEFFNTIIAEGLSKLDDLYFEADYYKNSNKELKKIKERVKKENAALNFAREDGDKIVEEQLLKEIREGQKQRRKDIEKKIRDKQEKSPL